MIELEHSTFTYYPKEEKEEAANNLHFFVVITSFEDSAITSGDLLGRQRHHARESLRECQR